MLERDRGAGRSLARTALHLSASLQISPPSPRAAVDLASLGQWSLKGDGGGESLSMLLLEHLKVAYQVLPCFPIISTRSGGVPGRAFIKDSIDYLALQNSPCVRSIPV